MTESMDPPFGTNPPSLLRFNWQARKVLRLRPRDKAAKTVRTEGFEPAAMLDAYARTAERFLALVRTLPEASGSLPVPGLTWTVAELVAHQYTVVRRGRDPRRAQTLDELGRLNQICVDEVRTRDLAELATLLEAEVALTGPLRRSLPLLWKLRVGRWLMLKLHFGIESDLPSVLLWPTTDMLLHGWELAQATGVDWEIPPADAAVCVFAGLPVMGEWVEPAVSSGPRRCRTVSFGHGLPAVTITVGEGLSSTRLEPAGSGVHVDEVDPVAWMLHVFGRTGPTGDDAIDEVASWTQAI